MSEPTCKICGWSSLTTVCQDCDAEYCSNDPQLLEQTRRTYGHINLKRPEPTEQK